MRFRRVQNVLSVLLCAALMLALDHGALPSASADDHEHIFGEPEWEWAPDYGTVTATFACSVCGASAGMFASIDIVTVSEPSCTTDEIVRFVASATFLGVTYTDTTDEVVLYEALGHYYRPPVWTWAPDYTTAQALFVCAACGEEHTVEADTVAETVVSSLGCETGDVVRYDASVVFDGETYTSSTPQIVRQDALGHAFEDPVWTWTERYDSAAATFTCARCGKMQSAPAQIEMQTVHPKTCTAGSVVQYTATAVFNEKQYVHTTGEITLADATGHDFGEWTYWNETAHRRVCVNCSEPETEAHNFAAFVTQPTCTSTGMTEYVCPDCGYSYYGEDIPALGHSFGEWITTTEPTFTAEGVQTRYCSRCAQTETRTLPPLSTDPTFRLSGGKAYAGETVEVSLHIDNNPGIISAMMSLSYDTQVLTLTGVRNGDLFEVSQLQLGGDLTAVPFNFFVIDALAQSDHTENGVLLTFVFRVAENAAAGETTVSLTYSAESTVNMQLQPVSFDARDAVLTTVPRMAGDVNGDGAVDLKDAVTLRRYFAENWNTTAILNNADVNGDKSVDLKDVVSITRFLVGGWGVELI